MAENSAITEINVEAGCCADTALFDDPARYSARKIQSVTPTDPVCDADRNGAFMER